MLNNNKNKYLDTSSLKSHTNKDHKEELEGWNDYFFNIKKFITTIIFILIIISLILNVLDIYSKCNTVDFVSNFLPSGDKNDNVPMDPVRWWPSGVPQGLSIVGTALATFGALSKVPGLPPRARVLGSLAAGGVSASTVTYHSAIENSVGFNRLMWGFSEYRKTGKWPSLDDVSRDFSEDQVKDFVKEAIKHADNTKVESVIKEVTGNKFLPSSHFEFSEFINKLIDLIFKNTVEILNPVYSQGFLDDLIGQRMFIEINLFILCILIILLLVIFIFNLIILLNIDKILTMFNNKFIKFYVKYQVFLSKFTLWFLSIFIIIGLFTLCSGLYWLVHNQIPYDSLDLDLHQYISPKKEIVMGLTLSLNKIPKGSVYESYSIKGFISTRFYFTNLKRENSNYPLSSHKLDISDMFTKLYNKYVEYLETLSADKIVCLFNLIVGGLVLSSFFSVISIMLSENVINKIAILERYPRILQLLKLRIIINKKIAKMYLLIHFIIIISGILGNLYMFFL